MWEWTVKRPTPYHKLFLWRFVVWLQEQLNKIKVFQTLTSSTLCHWAIVWQQSMCAFSFLSIFAEHFFVNCGFWDMCMVRLLLNLREDCRMFFVCECVCVWWMVRHRDKYSVTADIVLPSALPTQKPLIILLFDCCPLLKLTHTASQTPLEPPQPT